MSSFFSTKKPRDRNGERLNAGKQSGGRHKFSGMAPRDVYWSGAKAIAVTQQLQRDLQPRMRRAKHTTPRVGCPEEVNYAISC